MPSVLFVCTANQFRSPLAAALLINMIHQAHAAGNWRVESAGTWTRSGLPISATALQSANRLGLPGLDTHLTREVDQELLDQFDLILVMEINHQVAIEIEFPAVFGRLMLLSEIVDGLPYDIPDPADLNGDPQEIASGLQRLIQRGGKKILKMAQDLHQAREILVKDDL